MESGSTQVQEKTFSNEGLCQTRMCVFISQPCPRRSTPFLARRIVVSDEEGESEKGDEEDVPEIYSQDEGDVNWAVDVRHLFFFVLYNLTSIFQLQPTVSSQLPKASKRTLTQVPAYNVYRTATPRSLSPSSLHEDSPIIRGFSQAPPSVHTQKRAVSPLENGDADSNEDYQVDASRISQDMSSKGI
jgi:hypothetical protein